MIRQFLVVGISLPYQEPQESFCDAACRRVHKILPHAVIVHAGLYKQSLDCRRQDRICHVCTVHVSLECNEKEATRLTTLDPHIRPLQTDPMQISYGTHPLRGRVAVIGFGPCGMFAALVLAEHGYIPIIFERGDDIEDRIATVQAFRETHRLDPCSNVQFGAGGAGTFSDGKLTTRIHDAKCRFVLERLVSFGADPSILIQAKPHLGTDVLPGIVARIRDHLRAQGAEFYFRTTVQSFVPMPDGSLTLQTGKGSFSCGAAILAPGHSARDLYRTLLCQGYALEPKPFSVGVRIEHLQADINAAVYGKAASDPLLPPAEYALSYRSGERGVYSFCMCPGGEVVGAASEAGGVVVNGMSNSRRDGKNANAALAVSVLPADFSGDCLQAIAFQQNLEHAAFIAGGEDYACPIQTVGDYLTGRQGSEPKRVQPTYMAGHTKLAQLRAILPSFINEMLQIGIIRFGKQYKGFDAADAVLSAVETRTSAPVRILRTDAGNAIGQPLIFPAGEGAGYAGGITSAACDGVGAALRVMAHFAPPQAL